MTKQQAAYRLADLVMLNMSEKGYTLQTDADDMAAVLTLAQNGAKLFTTLVESVESIRYDSTLDHTNTNYSEVDKLLAHIHSNWEW